MDTSTVGLTCTHICVRFTVESCTSVSQKLSLQLEECLTKFYDDAGHYMYIGRYLRSLIGNMDEALAFFDIIPVKRICKTGSNECVI